MHLTQSRFIEKLEHQEKGGGLVRSQASFGNFRARKALRMTAQPAVPFMFRLKNRPREEVCFSLDHTACLSRGRRRHFELGVD